VTSSLWSWASATAYPGELLGAVEEPGATAIVYSVSEEDGEVRYAALRIPWDWNRRQQRILATSPAGDALALDDLEFEEYSPGFLDVESSIDSSVVRLDPRAALGCFVLPEDHPRFGFVPLIAPDGNRVHELHVYDEEHFNWVRVGVLDLGSGKHSTGRIVTGVVLTPVTAAIDFLILLCALMTPSPGAYYPEPAGSLEPTRMEQRDADWRALGAEIVPRR